MSGQPAIAPAYPLGDSIASCNIAAVSLPEGGSGGSSSLGPAASGAGGVSAGESVPFSSASPFLNPGAGSSGLGSNNPLSNLDRLAGNPLAAGGDSASGSEGLGTWPYSAAYGYGGTYAFPAAAAGASALAAGTAYAASMYGSPLASAYAYGHPHAWMRGGYPHGGYAGGATGPGGKKGRQTYQRWQTTHLESAYLQNKYVTKKHRAELVAVTHLSDRQVKIWFQNRRMKDKKDKKREEEERELEKSKQQQAAAASHPGPSAHHDPADPAFAYHGYPGHHPHQGHYKPEPRVLPPVVQPLQPYPWPHKQDPDPRYKPDGNPQ